MKFKDLYENSKKAVTDTLDALWCSEVINDSTESGNESFSSQLKAQAEEINKKVEEMISPRDAMPVVQYAEKYLNADGLNGRATADDAKRLVQDADGNSLWDKKDFYFDPTSQYYNQSGWDYNTFTASHHTGFPMNPYLPYQHQYECWKTLSEEVELPNGNMAKKSMVVTTGTGSGKTECFMLPLVSDLLRGGETGKLQAIFLYPLNALMEDQKQRLQELLSGTDLHFCVYNGNLPETVENNEDEIIEEIKRYPNICPTRNALRGDKDSFSDGSKYGKKEVEWKQADIILTNPSMLEYMLLRWADQGMIGNSNLKWMVIDETHTYTGAGATELAMLIRRVLLACGTTSENVRFATSSATIGNAQDVNTAASNSRKLKQFIMGITGQMEEQITIVNGTKKTLADDEALRKAIGNNEELRRIHTLLSEKEFVSLEELDEVYDTRPEKNIESRLAKLDTLCEGENGIPLKTHFFYRVLTQGLRVRLDQFNSKKGYFEIYSNEPVDSKIPFLELRKCSCCGGYVAVGEKNDADDGDQRDTYRRTTLKDGDVFDFDDVKESKKPLFFGILNERRPMYKQTRVVNVCENKISPREWPEDEEYAIVESQGLLCPYCGTNFGESKKDENSENQEETDDKKLTSFRLSSDFVARLMAPALLNQMNKEDGDHPHNGQQYLSFVDSRQAAARATLRQMKEVERQWVYSKIFHKLCKKKRNNEAQNYLEWNEILNLLREDSNAERLCLQSTNRADELDGDKPNFRILTQYILSLMFDALAKRPFAKTSPENMGLFTSYYKKLDEITESPCEEFCLQEWKNLLKAYLDRYVRANFSVFLEYTEGRDRFDVESCKRFASQKYRTGLARKSDGGIIDKLIVASLLKLDGDVSMQQISDFIKNSNEQLKRVHEQLWKSIVDCGLISKVTDYKNCEDAEGNLIVGRLNLKYLSFKLFNDVFYCNVSKSNRSTILRPYDTLVYGYSPFAVGGGVVKLNQNRYHERWECFPENVTTEEGVLEWARKNRSKMFEFKLWGEHGRFSNRLTQIYKGYSPFIQAEHTAQVDKDVAKLSQKMFREHDINILACSTTMEMGVNLGGLELVMMNSVPPHPANYKQRAGRSGRGGQKRSACVTLCGSDSIGIRTLRNPLKEIIHRKTSVPFVDFHSKPVILRHINAYLLRKFYVESDFINNNNVVTKDVIHFFCDCKDNYKVDKNPLDARRKAYKVFIQSADGCMLKNPTDEFCNPKRNDIYTMFINQLDDYQADVIPAALVRDTDLDTANDKQMAIQNTNKRIKEIHNELAKLFGQLSMEYENAIKQKNKNKQIQIDLTWVKVHGQNLMEFFSKKRFTPNANMPINIVELDTNNRYVKTNPSYQLRESLSQYAPGNCVVLSNQVKVVSGVQWTTDYREFGGRKFLFHHGDEVASSPNLNATPFDGKEQIWNINGRKVLTYLPPCKFSVEKEEEGKEEYTRVEERNRYTQVNAQLIDVTDWQGNAGEHLYCVRTNADEGNGRIFYYNQGDGYGYCICPTCGKAVLETEPENFPKQGVPCEKNVPSGFYEKEKIKINLSTVPQSYHKHVRGYGKDFDNHKIKNVCLETNVWRNVVIGDCIQTDFAEIKIRKTVTSHWIANNSDDDSDGNAKLLTTLGIVFTRVLTEYLGKESRDVDFLVMHNGHLCIFDTNPGGSGYSNQLGGENSIMDIIIDRSEELLSSIQSKDEILDKFSLRYLDKVDVEKALNWIRDEQRLRPILPKEVEDVYPNAYKARFSELKDDLIADNDSQLFVNDKFAEWNYKDDANEDEVNWRSRLLEVRNTGNSYSLNVVTTKENNYPVIAYRVFDRIRDWCKLYRAESPLDSKFYPIAIANNWLYFTTKKEFTCLNEDWAKESLFKMSVDGQMNFDTYPLNTTRPDSLKKFILRNVDGRKNKVSSKQLAEFVFNYDECARTIVDGFFTFCKEHPGHILNVTYQDEHMKSPMGVVTGVQFLNWFIERINPEEVNVKFLLEKYYSTGNPLEDAEEDMREIGRNMTNEARNQFLDRILDSWYESKTIIKDCYKEERAPKELPHWRVMQLEYAGALLEVYPNGGIINGWNLDEYNRNILPPKDFSEEWETQIPLYMKDNEIMYDIKVELPE